MKLIYLTNGGFTKVDDEDYELLMKYPWRRSVIHGYVIRAAQKHEKRKTHLVLMHVEILNPRHGFQVDHINGDRRDNQRSNLRECTSEQNHYNHLMYKNNTSGYKGVSLRNGYWRAVIYKNKKQIHIGYFNDAEEAAKAYDKAARENFGEFAKTNF